MASAHVTWSSEWEAFKQQLRTLPDDLTGEAGTIVLSSGEAAHGDIAAGYTERFGNLKRGLKLSKSDAGRFGASVSLRNSSKIAWLYEHGSQARHYVTRNGKKHLTGRMPPTHVFVRTVVKHKRLMVESLKNMVRRHGLTVAGE